MVLSSSRPVTLIWRTRGAQQLQPLGAYHRTLTVYIY